MYDLWHDEDAKDVDAEPEEVGREEGDDRQDVDEDVQERWESGKERVVLVYFRLLFMTSTIVIDSELLAPRLLPDVALVLDVADLELVVEPADTVPRK